MTALKTYVLTGGFFTEQPIATCSKDLNDREGGSGKPIPVPHTTTAAGRRLYFPATGIRGKLRRCARDVVRDLVIAKTGKTTPFTLDEHYMLTLGGVKGDAASEKASVAHEAYWREKNPLLSIFGAGDAGMLGFVTGHLSVGNAICKDDVEETVFSGARTDEFYRDRVQVSYLSPEDITSLVMRAEGNRDSSSLKKDLKAAEAALKKAKRQGDAEAEAVAQADVQRLEAEIDAVKSESGTGAVSVGMPLAGWKAIPQGQHLDQSMFLQRSNPVELGLLVAALDRFSLAPVLGAHSANGCGLVSGEWSVAEVTANGRRALGAIRVRPFDRLEIDGPELADAMKSFLDHASAHGDFRLPRSEIVENA